MAYLYQISVSDGGVPKLSVPEAHITEKGVNGDRQKTPKIHGGPDRAVCLYSLELIQALQADGHSIAPGSSGENLTVAGVNWPRLSPGDHVRIGESLLLEITSYTTPCKLNGQWFRDLDFMRISQIRYPGWSRLYARVLHEGTVRTHDRVIVEFLDVPEEALT